MLPSGYAAAVLSLAPMVALAGVLGTLLHELTHYAVAHAVGVQNIRVAWHPDHRLTPCVTYEADSIAAIRVVNLSPVALAAVGLAALVWQSWPSLLSWQTLPTLMLLLALGWLSTDDLGTGEVMGSP